MQANLNSTNDSTNQQTHRQTLVADALRAAAAAVVAGDDANLVTMLSVALFNLPDQISRMSLYMPLMSIGPAGGWDRWEPKQ